MQKVLIAVHAQLLGDALELALSSCFEVHRCETGADIGRLTERLRPEALVIGLRLPDGDGLSVLEQCRHKPPAVLMLTDLINGEVIQRAADVGIGALVLVPCSVRHVAEILDRLTAKIPSPEG